MSTQPSSSSSSAATTTTAPNNTGPPSPPSSAGAPPNYRIHHLPHPCPDHLISPFTSLRLRAHTLSPGSFASTFAQEASRTPAQWSEHLSRPDFHVFILALHPSSPSPSSSPPPSHHHPHNDDNGDDDAMDAIPWLGHISLLGPLPKHTYDVPLAHSPHPSLPDALESKWHMTALWTDPAHRGRGLASKLVNAAIDFAINYVPTPTPTPNTETTESGTLKQARIRINTSPTPRILSLYRHWGFRDAGRACLAVAMRENGDEDFLPAVVREGGDDGGGGGEDGGKKWWDWRGVCLERVVEVRVRVDGGGEGVWSGRE